MAADMWTPCFLGGFLAMFEPLEGSLLVLFDDSVMWSVQKLETKEMLKYKSNCRLVFSIQEKV